MHATAVLHGRLKSHPDDADEHLGVIRQSSNGRAGMDHCGLMVALILSNWMAGLEPRIP